MPKLDWIKVQVLTAMLLSEIDCSSDWSIEAKNCDELTGRFTLGSL